MKQFSLIWKNYCRANGRKIIKLKEIKPDYNPFNLKDIHKIKYKIYGQQYTNLGRYMANDSTRRLDI